MSERMCRVHCKSIDQLLEQKQRPNDSVCIRKCAIFAECIGCAVDAYATSNFAVCGSGSMRVIRSDPYECGLFCVM